MKDCPRPVDGDRDGQDDESKAAKLLDVEEFAPERGQGEVRGRIGGLLPDDQRKRKGRRLVVVLDTKRRH